MLPIKLFVASSFPLGVNSASRAVSRLCLCGGGSWRRTARQRNSSPSLKRLIDVKRFSSDVSAYGRNIGRNAQSYRRYDSIENDDTPHCQCKVAQDSSIVVPELSASSASTRDTAILEREKQHNSKVSQGQLMIDFIDCGREAPKDYVTVVRRPEDRLIGQQDSHIRLESEYFPFPRRPLAVVWVRGYGSSPVASRNSRPPRNLAHKYSMGNRPEDDEASQYAQYGHFMLAMAHTRHGTNTERPYWLCDEPLYGWVDSGTDHGEYKDLNDLYLYDHRRRVLGGQMNIEGAFEPTIHDGSKPIKRLCGIPEMRSEIRYVVDGAFEARAQCWDNPGKVMAEMKKRGKRFGESPAWASKMFAHTQRARSAYKRAFDTGEVHNSLSMAAEVANKLQANALRKLLEPSQFMRGSIDEVANELMETDLLVDHREGKGGGLLCDLCGF